MHHYTQEKPKLTKKTRGDGFSGFVKCDRCDELMHKTELKKSLNCCQKCGHHYRISSDERIKLLVDDESFEELFTHVISEDTLSFTDSKPYTKRLKEAEEKTGKSDAITVGRAKISSVDTCLAVMNFEFMGGSMGRALGERLTLLIEYATLNKLPLVIVSASGGARMQESTIALMQMAKTSSALARHAKLKLPYISILTNPTSGGVTASFASLGDIILAEPGALICFAGPRVIEQTLRKKLPKGAQRAEFLLQHGMIDSIVTRHELKLKLSQLLKHLIYDSK